MWWSEQPSHSLDTVEAVLRRRGHILAGTGNPDLVLFPRERVAEITQGFLMRPGGRDRYAELFRATDLQEAYQDWFTKSSFRKTIRRLMSAQGQTVAEISLISQVGEETTRRYLDVLHELQVIERFPAGIRLTRRIDNIGPSLEDHVAWLCRHHLSGQAEWGVQLEGLPRAGGDYDVLAWLSPVLLYVECKSSRPSDIHESELRHFLQRHIELAPELSVLLVDTDDDLTDLREHLNAILRPVAGDNWGRVAQLRYRMLEVGPDLQPLPDYPGIAFGGLVNVYVTNSQPSILRQLQRCLQHYYALVRGQAILAPSLLNFLPPI